MHTHTAKLTLSLSPFLSPLMHTSTIHPLASLILELAQNILQALELDLDLVSVSTTSVCWPCLIRASENNWPRLQQNCTVFSPSRF